MRKWWKQFWCLHWFGEVTEHDHEEAFGAIINLERRTRIVTEEWRTCSRCGLLDRRTIKCEFTGWS